MEGGRDKPILPQKQNYLRNAPRLIRVPRSRRVSPFVRATWHPLNSAKLQKSPYLLYIPGRFVLVVPDVGSEWPVAVLCRTLALNGRLRSCNTVTLPRGWSRWVGLWCLGRGDGMGRAWWARLCARWHWCLDVSVLARDSRLGARLVTGEGSWALRWDAATSLGGHFW